MPAGSTYTPIATVTTSGSVSTYTFSSIPSTYTDIVAVGNFQLSTRTAFRCRVNGDTGSNYSATSLSGNGTSAVSQREANVANWVVGGWQAAAGTDYANVTTLNFMNYANTSTYKTVIGRFGNASEETVGEVLLWRNTSAINSITFYVASGNFVDGSTFTLWGIQSA